MGMRGKRDEILHVAKRLFREKGYHGTTIRDIADETGLLSGSLYAHIHSKEDLLFEITDEVAEQFLTVMKAITCSASPEDTQTLFRNALAAHVNVVARHLDAASVFSHEWRQLTGERYQVIQKKRDAYESMWAELIDKGVHEGVFRPGMERFFRVTTLSVANWLYQWYDRTGPLTPDEIAEQMSDVLLRGMLAR